MMQLEPITRAEQIMSGQDLIPITREEMFLAKAAGRDVETPTPITRRELFLSQISGGSGGSVGSDFESDFVALIDKTITKASNNKVTKVADSAFMYCGSLVSVDFPVATSVGITSFRNCVELKSVNIPLVTNIGQQAFESNVKLESINMKSVEVLGNSAFRYCSKLNSVDLPNVTSIGTYCFNSCGNLRSVLLRNTETVCTLADKYAFVSTAIGNLVGYIYVPSNLIDAYISATNWSNFSGRFRALENYTVDGTTTGELDESKI